MARKDERFEVTVKDLPMTRAESSSLDGAMRFAQKFQQYGRIATIRDRRTGNTYTAYGKQS